MIVIESDSCGCNSLRPQMNAPPALTSLASPAIGPREVCMLRGHWTFTLVCWRRSISKKHLVLDNILSEGLSVGAVQNVVSAPLDSSEPAEAYVSNLACSTPGCQDQRALVDLHDRAPVICSRGPAKPFVPCRMSRG